MGFNDNQKACIYTLLYSDIFNFPLTEEELFRNIISNKKIDRSELEKTAKSLSKIIVYQNGFYCLKGKEKIIGQRKKRAKITQAKLEIARRVAKYLVFIPAILFIGITGRLGHMDADREDDIDMFFITKKNYVWTTRILILAVLELLNARRTRDDTNPENKICPNLIIDETALAWPTEKHDIFTAHEIVQIYPLYSKNNIYQNFLNSNKWVRRFYANATFDLNNKNYIKKPRQYLTLKAISFILTLPPIEYILSKFQREHMRSKRTNETILPNFLAFHPQDKRAEILNSLSEKINQFNLEDYLL